jgi:hypothetical protein
MISLLAGVSHAPTAEVSTAPVPPPHYVTLSWMAFGIVVACIMTWAIFHWRSARLNGRQNSPRRLFRELAKLHYLSWSERRQLSQLARKLKLREPARLFVEPELWAQLPADSTGQRPLQLAALQAKLMPGTARLASLPT